MVFKVNQAIMAIYVVLATYFIGRALTEVERKELLAAACYMHVERERIARSFIDSEW